MMLLRAAVVENDEKDQARLTKVLKEWEKEKAGKNEQLQIDYFTEGEKFLKHEINYQVVFLDIDLDGKLNGMQVAFRLRERGCDIPIVFLTGFDTFVFDGYLVNAMQYIMKPVVREKVDFSMNRIVAQHTSSYYLYQSKGKTIRIAYREICYLSFHSHYVELVTLKTRFKQRISVKEIEKILPDEFVKCNSGTFANITYVEKLLGSILVMKDGERIPVSKPYLNVIQDRYVKWLD